MADEVPGARARQVAPARQPPERECAPISVEQGLAGFWAEVHLHVLIAETPPAGEGQRRRRAVGITVSDLVGAVRGGDDAIAGAVGHDEAAGAAVALAIGDAIDMPAADHR